MRILTQKSKNNNLKYLIEDKLNSLSKERYEIAMKILRAKFSTNIYRWKSLKLNKGEKNHDMKVEDLYFISKLLGCSMEELINYDFEVRPLDELNQSIKNKIIEKYKFCK